tara:strand:+ start:8 stop:526 length:519 start_codon:yes stop_codon:yes gene_type:complete
MSLIKVKSTSIDGSLGITSASQYRLTTDTTNSGLSSGIIVNNWEINDSNGYASLGSPVTQSSGIFTFPSTGIWLIQGVFAFYEDTGGTDTITAQMIGTRNNFSNDNDQAENFTTVFDGYSNASVTGEHIYDVSDTSNHKMKFGIAGLQEGNYLRGNTNKNSTSITFIRLGDT